MPSLRPPSPPSSETEDDTEQQPGAPGPRFGEADGCDRDQCPRTAGEDKGTPGLEEAILYLKIVTGLEVGNRQAWIVATEAGQRALFAAGDVPTTAKAMWAAREHLGLNNLEGVKDPDLDELLDQDVLAYLRDVEAHGASKSHHVR